MDVLVVDGYNVIGDWEELNKLKQKDIGLARVRLLDILSEYQGFTKNRVIVVFDALYVKGSETRETENNVDIIYTKEDETADECIERNVQSLIYVKNQVYVATSYYMEQRTIFSRGALRISARELLVEIKNMDKYIDEQLEMNRKKQPKQKIEFHDHIRIQFEKWRDRKSTRLNSSHVSISYAVFCLKKKKRHKSMNRPGADHSISYHSELLALRTRA